MAEAVLETPKTETVEEIQARIEKEFQANIKTLQESGFSALDSNEVTKEIIPRAVDKADDSLHEQWQTTKNKTVEEGHWRKPKFASNDEKADWEAKYATKPHAYNKETDEINLLALDQDELPDAWATENRKAADIAVNVVAWNLKQEKPLSYTELASLVHDQWMIRNAENLLSLLDQGKYADRLQALRDRIRVYLTSKQLPVSSVDLKTVILTELYDLVTKIPPDSGDVTKQFLPFSSLERDQQYLDQDHLRLASEKLIEAHRTYELKKGGEPPRS